jgi:hypothetical protein
MNNYWTQILMDSCGVSVGEHANLRMFDVVITLRVCVVTGDDCLFASAGGAE